MYFILKIMQFFSFHLSHIVSNFFPISIIPFPSHACLTGVVGDGAQLCAGHQACCLGVRREKMSFFFLPAFALPICSCVFLFSSWAYPFPLNYTFFFSFSFSVSPLPLLPLTLVPGRHQPCARSSHVAPPTLQCSGTPLSSQEWRPRTSPLDLSAGCRMPRVGRKKGGGREGERENKSEERQRRRRRRRKYNSMEKDKPKKKIRKHMNK